MTDSIREGLIVAFVLWLVWLGIMLTSFLVTR